MDKHIRTTKDLALTNGTGSSTGSSTSASTSASAGGVTGVLLVNLGTPDSPEPEAVGRYLKSLLMDKYVIDLPYPLRWGLVNLLIVPRRKHTSAHAYKEIWTERGSPLSFHSKDFTSLVAENLGPKYRVELAMACSSPSIPDGLSALKSAGCDPIVVLPLFPQFAESTTVSAVEQTQEQARRIGYHGDLVFMPAFYADPGYIGASAALIQEVWERERPEHLLLSFHGLPERQIKRCDRSPNRDHCLSSASCCEKMVSANRDCYRAQCFSTARSIAHELGLPDSAYTVSFQSRLGRAAWIGPETDTVLRDLAGALGIRRLAVACPSFTADCLETIEEIGIRGEETFRLAGGDALYRIPCLNSDPRWVSAAAEFIRATAASLTGTCNAHSVGLHTQVSRSDRCDVASPSTNSKFSIG